MGKCTGTFTDIYNTAPAHIQKRNQEQAKGSEEGKRDRKQAADVSGEEKEQSRRTDTEATRRSKAESNPSGSGSATGGKSQPTTNDNGTARRRRQNPDTKPDSKDTSAATAAEAPKRRLVFKADVSIDDKSKPLRFLFFEVCVPLSK